MRKLVLGIVVVAGAMLVVGVFGASAVTSKPLLPDDSGGSPRDTRVKRRKEK